MTAPNGETRTARTNPFGFYSFAGVAAGQTYVAAVASKSFRYEAQIFSAIEETNRLDFAPQP